MSKVARVAIASNLPQLDRFFDYLVPDQIEPMPVVGSRVKVTFGNSAKLLDGFIVEIADSTTYKGELSPIAEVIDSNEVLKPEILSLCQDLAARNATTLGDLIKLAIPSHMPRAAQAHKKLVMSSSIQDDYSRIPRGSFDLVEGHRYAIVARPTLIETGTSGQRYPDWAVRFCDLAATNLKDGKSSILLVPDFREHQILSEALRSFALADWVADYSQEQPKSKRYSAFLRALEARPVIVVGSRAASFAPAHNLGSIAIYDESDFSFVDQSSPYLHTRDVILIRQSVQNCSLIFASHSRSPEIQRLVESRYLQEATADFPKPKVSVSEPGFRVDSNAYRAIKKGLESGSVLVQVASKGESSSLFCSVCEERAHCKTCSGPIWIDPKGQQRCRWCNAFATDQKCSCGSTSFSFGRAGATRTASELGKAFPGVRVIESTGDQRIQSVPTGTNLVIATAGAEPYASDGYQAVILLDAKVLLARQSLRALDEAIRLWSNAVAKLAPSGEAVLVGVSGRAGQSFALWNQIELASMELSARKELELPPSLRLGTVAGDQALLAELRISLDSITGVKTIGPAPFSSEGQVNQWRLIFKYSYSVGLELAKAIKAEVYRLSAGKTAVSKSGRNTRLLKVRMNDAEVV